MNFREVICMFMPLQRKREAPLPPIKELRASMKQHRADIADEARQISAICRDIRESRPVLKPAGNDAR